MRSDLSGRNACSPLTHPPLLGCCLSLRLPFQQSPQQPQCFLKLEASHATSFPGGPMVKTPPANAGDTGLIVAPGRNQVGQLSPCTATTQRVWCRARAPKQERPRQWGVCTPQLERGHVQQHRPNPAPPLQTKLNCVISLLQRYHNPQNYPLSSAHKVPCDLSLWSVPSPPYSPSSNHSFLAAIQMLLL